MIYAYSCPVHVSLLLPVLLHFLNEINGDGDVICCERPRYAERRATEHLIRAQIMTYSTKFSCYYFFRFFCIIGLFSGDHSMVRPMLQWCEIFKMPDVLYIMHPTNSNKSLKR